MLNLIIMYGTKLVNILLLLSSGWSKFLIFSSPFLVKAFAVSWFEALKIFCQLFCWDSYFFSLVLISMFNDLWIVSWYWDYASSLAAYKANALTSTPIPEVSIEAKCKLYEKSAQSSLDKTGYYGGTIVILYITLILVGMAVGVC